jgi:serine/threonine protein kinase
MTRSRKVEELLNRARVLGLLPLVHLNKLLGNYHRSPFSLKSLTEHLLDQKWLTRYQIEMLVHGSDTDLILGPYTLLDRLGQGGMGEVFKAQHRTLGRIVALKRLRPEAKGSESVAKRFQREMHAAARLHHPNIVMALDADEIDGVPFLVLEWFDGINLAQLVRQTGPLAIDLACSCIRQGALALDHAHKSGLIHRDVKPHNLMVDQNGVVKLLDLGLARLSNQSSNDVITQDNQMIGTADYFAPEQAEDAREVDGRADLYSLGCTFYHLLIGKPPFDAIPDVLGKMIQHRLNHPPALQSLRTEVPPAIVAIVEKLMAKDPKDRFATGAEVALALEDYC